VPVIGDEEAERRGWVSRTLGRLIP
jgi:hypothetical protein